MGGFGGLVCDGGWVGLERVLSRWNNGLRRIFVK